MDNKTIFRGFDPMFNVTFVAGLLLIFFVLVAPERFSKLPSPPPPPPSLCTSFEYSDWSLCDASGTQRRTVAKSLPVGCSGGNASLSQICKYEPTTPPPLPPDGLEISSCTNFDYTYWSHCAADGTQSRMITAAYPNGCNIADSGIIQGQEQLCAYVPIQANAQELLTVVATQIKNAPGGSIQASYISGPAGGSLVKISWLMSDDNNLLIDQLTTDRYTGEVTEHILMRDTDRDFRPNVYSQNGTDWYQVARQNQSTQTQLITLWAYDMAYFGSYLLNY